jgi:hypothetical protein
MSTQITLYGGQFDGQSVAWPDGAQTDVLTGAGGTLWTYEITEDQTTAVLTRVDAAPPPAPPAVPPQVTRWQAMQQMLATPSKVNPAPATLLTDVQTIVAATGGAMALAWANQQYLYRNGPFLTPALMSQVGLASADVDAMFIAAALLPQ